MLKKIILLKHHLKNNKKDQSTRRGLLKLVGRRKKLLSYLKNKELSSRQFLEMTSILQPLAEKGDYPVLISAQVFEKDGEIGPYFGKSLMHLSKTIIHLERTKRASFRQIRLKKHRSLPEELVESFILTNNGLE